MKKGSKIFVTILLIIILLISFGFIYILFFKPLAGVAGPQSNTYAENSSIDHLEYAVKFTYGDIEISNFINITNGRINGYPIVNSTDCTNCTINIDTRLIAISLHNDVNVSLKNINYPGISIYLHDESSLIVENCTFDELWLFDFSSAIIKNSSIFYIRVSPPFEVPVVYYYQTSLSIINNSTVYNIFITEGCDLFIKDSKLLGTWSIYIETLSPLIKITGNIENSTLQRVRVKGYANLRFYGTSLEEVHVHDMARITLEQSTVASQYSYGIVAYSGTTSIDAGKITGTNYINNTRLINSVVFNPLLVSVAANNSAVVNMNNFSCSVYLHGNSKATIANLTDSSLIFTHFSTFYGTLRDSSSLKLENNDFSMGYLTCLDNGELILTNTVLSDLYCDTTNSITINKCNIGSIWTYSFYANLAKDNIYIVNSTIFTLNLGGKDVANVENCTISKLYEGIIIFEGSLSLDMGGFTGTGSYMNSTTLINNNILISRGLRLIEVNGTARLSIEDYFSEIDILCIDDSEVILQNSTADNLIARDSAKVIGDNFSIYEQLYLLDDSILEANQISYLDGLITMGNSFVTITDASIYVVYVLESSRVSVQNSDILSVYVLGWNKFDYAFKAYNSTIFSLSTYTWS